MPPDGKPYKKLSAFNTNATPESTDLLVSISSTGENQNVPISSVHKVDSVNGMAGAVVLDPSDIGADALGSAAQALVDSKIYTDSEIAAIDTGVQSVVAGTGIAVDATDPANPIVTNTQTSAEWGNITGNLSSQTDLNNALGGKVDKVTGKQLSANDYTNLEKTKLSGIEDEAEKNVNSDWNAVSGDAQILNKPTIPTKTSDITNDSGFITTEADPTVPAWAKTPSKPTYTKTDVGLGDVDNTSDLSKPISTATQAALNAKENTLTKGNLVAGTNVTLTGTLTNRLVGSGDVTIETNGGGGITPDTEENLLSSTPDGSGYVIATDTLRGLYYNADNTQWYITSIPLSTELANPDAGYTQDSDKRGYGDDYIYGKKMYATGIGDFTDTPYEGAIKVDQDFTPAKYQIYLRGKWNTLFYDLTMENGDFEHVPQTYSIDVRSGNSNTTGLNGQPIIREYKVDAGAYPREVIIDGGNLND